MPADCSDGNACTTDVCQAGTCLHRREGFDAVACELGKLTTPTDLCAPDPIYPKLAKAFTIKGTLARNFVGRAENNTKTGQNLLNRAVKQLNGLSNKVGRAGDRGKITPSCLSTLETLLTERLGLVQGLATP